MMQARTMNALYEIMKPAGKYCVGMIIIIIIITIMLK